MFPENSSATERKWFARLVSKLKTVITPPEQHIRTRSRIYYKKLEAMDLQDSDPRYNLRNRGEL